MMLKYSRAATNLRELEELGCAIMHGVDAHTMSKHPLLNQKLFDRIVYNFPATALKRSESNTRQIEYIINKRVRDSAGKTLPAGNCLTFMQHSLVAPLTFPTTKTGNQNPKFQSPALQGSHRHAW
ncbi:hypothetical protein D5086_014089 [Populus alba]|uniref:Uncharacterized protein n=1 Tax=Populus alba TaxID=43335 RepID=A0ACC4C8R4_POPAL